MVTKCKECFAMLTATQEGLITGCEHHLVVAHTTPNRRTTFLELLQKHTISGNVVTQSVYRDIIKARIDNVDYT